MRLGGWSLIMLAAAASFETSVAADQRRVEPGPSEWRLLGRTAEMQHYSPLTQINASNVSHLGLRWYADIPTKGGLLGNPLVADGIVYQSGIRGTIWANDLRTGRLLWEFDPKIRFDGSIIVDLGAVANRGLALGERFVYVGTPDCRLIAVDRMTGKESWEATACEGGLTISGAPRVGAGKGVHRQCQYGHHSRPRAC